MIRSYLSHAPTTEQLDSLIPLLPPWRREKLASLRHESARCLSVGAGLLWCRAMTDLGLDPTVPVRYLPAGKPVTDGAHFSLSHSGTLCFCVVSDRPVGADVQEYRPAKLSVARRFCPEEQEYLLALPEGEQIRALIALWARKEAWVKAESRDRMLPLDEYNVLADAGPWVFTDHTYPGGYALAVCASEPAPEIIEVVL